MMVFHNLPKTIFKLISSCWVDSHTIILKNNEHSLKIVSELCNKTIDL